MVNQVEIDEMVVMENLDFKDFKAGMERWDHRGRKVTWENRDLLDPGLEESLMSGGVYKGYCGVQHNSASMRRDANRILSRNTLGGPPP